MRVLRLDGSDPRMIVRYVWQSGLIALTALVLVFLLARTTPFEDFDRWTYDFTVINAGLARPHPRIVLVDFDDDTFARIKRFPIPRADVADVVARIGAQKPRVIGMDILLSEPRLPEEDKKMQDALTSAGVVILASQYSGGDIPTDMPLAIFCQPEDARAVSGFCKEGTPGGMGYAFINMPVDQDGFVRQAFTNAGQSPGFAVTLAQQYTGEAFKALDHRRFSFLGRTLWYSDPDLKEMLIGSWGRQPATTVSAWKVLAGEVPANTFTDKLVLMGQSSDAARDRHYTPLFRYSLPNGSRPSMGGTQVHAAAILSLLDGTVVRPAPPYMDRVAILVMCWVAAFLILLLETKFGMTGWLAILTAPFLLALGLYVKERFWLPYLGQETALIMTLPFTLFVQFLSERVLAQEQRNQRMQLMTLFSSYVGPAVAGTIWERRDEVSLNGEERIATVMFTDIRSFTALSAGKPPAEVLAWLNQYMTAMDEVIRLHGGFLNKFIGDGLMIIFGLPLSHGVRHDAGRGLHAALAMLERVELLNRENAPYPDRPQLRIGCGLHTGPLMAGSIGSANRQEYSVIGETVNLASRLESLNKPFKTEILMSQATHDLLVDDFTGFEALGETKVAGFEEPVPVFTIRPATAE
jgi:adenylate cyclase